MGQGFLKMSVLSSTFAHALSDSRIPFGQQLLRFFNYAEKAPERMFNEFSGMNFHIPVFIMNHRKKKTFLFRMRGCSIHDTCRKEF
jgi:hypothetical protein